jgi:hypothetical protein
MMTTTIMISTRVKPFCEVFFMVDIYEYDMNRSEVSSREIKPLPREAGKVN